MLVIGLTGSIATGKSTVSRLLSAPPHSIPVIDADKLARQVVEPGTSGYVAVLKHFQSSTPDLLQPPSAEMPEDGPNGKGRPLDRAALGRRVFGMQDEIVKDRNVLNGIVHPAVRRAMVRAVLAAYVQGNWAVVLDVPLLFESGLDVFCGIVVMVGMKDAGLQLRRLLERDKEMGGTMTVQEAQQRIASQGSVEGKVARVEARGDVWGEVLWNDGSKADLRAEVDKTVADIKTRSPRWWQTVLWALPPLALLLAAWAMWYGVQMRNRYEAEEKRKTKEAIAAKL